jgi:hypothetical protein
VTPRSRPIVLQIPVMLFLTGSASAIGMGIRDVLLASPMPEVIGVWAGGLAAPITLAAVMGLWRSARSSLGWFLGASVLIYLTAGLLAGAFARQLSPPALLVPERSEGAGEDRAGTTRPRQRPRQRDPTGAVRAPSQTPQASLKPCTCFVPTSGVSCVSGDSHRRISSDFLDFSHGAHVQILSSASHFKSMLYGEHARRDVPILYLPT